MPRTIERMPMTTSAVDHPDGLNGASHVAAASRRVLGGSGVGSVGSGDAGFGTVLDMASS
jgi:hypothetical protein